MNTSMNRREFLGVLAAAMGATMARGAEGAEAPPRLNVLLITADDMNCDTLGVYGCKTPDITPNLDKLAGQGMLFRRAHVTVAVCQPSRQTLMTGRYPHRSGSVGFYPIRKDVPTLQESLHAAGYMNGILSKVGHLEPQARYCWDYVKERDDLGLGRDPRKYYESSKEFFQKAKEAGRPFFLMANSNDPHRPWAGSDQEKGRAAGRDGPFPPASRYYKKAEVEVPGFLADLPPVRNEMAQYYSSAHRCDETVGEVLRALAESGFEEQTLVMFLSDNGISMPFAKSNCYLHSTHTPWIVRWPGKVEAGRVDEEDYISGIDFMATILEATGLKPVEGMDGKSFVPLLLGKEQAGREHVFTCYNETSARGAFPMRCLRDKRFGYIFNAWSDGKTTYIGEPLSGHTFAAMQSAAKNDPTIAKRVELLRKRVPEELYDMEADRDSLNNLIDKAEHKERVMEMRERMLRWMVQTGDPQAENYRKVIGAK